MSTLRERLRPENANDWQKHKSKAYRDYPLGAGLIPGKHSIYQPLSSHLIKKPLG